MASASGIGAVREGMEVLTSDGTSLGRVRSVYLGTEPRSSYEQCEDESCVEVHRGGVLGRGVTVYVPCRAIGTVSGEGVTLNVDTETASAKGWARRPAWIGK